MAQTGEQLVAEIQRDLACPACEYNLRGLRGDIVECPECGAMCDVAQLIANQWTLPWHRAPKLNTVYAPVAWVTVAPFVLILTLAITDRVIGESSVWAAMMMVGAVLSVGWCLALWRAYGVFAGLRGVWLAFISHLLFAAYMVGFGALFGVISVVRGIFVADALAIVVGLFSAAVGVPLIWLARRGEKYVARHCIRRHLQLQIAADI